MCSTYVNSLRSSVYNLLQLLELLLLGGLSIQLYTKLGLRGVATQ